MTARVNLSFAPAAGKCATAVALSSRPIRRMTLRLVAEDWGEIRFHDECHHIW
jgi:hypothetical protein